MRRTKCSTEGNRRSYIPFAALFAIVLSASLTFACGPGHLDGSDSGGGVPADVQADATDGAGDIGQRDTGGPGGDAGPGPDGSVDPDTGGTDTSTMADTDACVPDCSGKACGADGCGGTCGSCDDGESCTADNQCQPSTVSFKDEVLPIFEKAGCAVGACHAYPSPPAGLNLRPHSAHRSLVGAASTQCSDRPRVKAGAPEDSYLIAKLKGENLCEGERMPLGKPALADADIQTIRRWIADGAPDN